ncbi:MAG: 5'-nucleotidase C-terminal domain-containing protein [Pseudomonadota bacterium]
MYAVARVCPLFVLFCLISGFVSPSALWSEAAGETLKLTILHMNDPHAHYVPYEKKGVDGLIGGFGKAASVLGTARARSASECRSTLVLMAGDLLMGTEYSTVFKGTLGVTLMNQMKFDAMTVGNHEFDYGQSNLISTLKPLMQFPLLSGNIKTVDGKHVFDGVVIKKFPDSPTRIVILGLTTSDTPVTTLPDNVRGLVFNDPIETARGLLTDINHKDFVVALTHLGIAEDRKLAEACPKIDVIIGGHSHTKLFTPEKAGNALICQAGAYAEFLGKLDVDVTDGKVVSHKGELILLGPAVEEDPHIASIIKSRKDEMGMKLEEVIGTTEVFLDGTMHSMRAGTATNLGGIITSVMARNCGAEAALVNGGAIRESLKEGPITIGEMYSVLPFRDTLVKLDLSGEDLRNALQQSHDLPDGSGGKLQVFGVTRSVENGKVRIGKVAGKDFDPAGVYSVAINNFLLAGGDGYKIFAEKGKNVDKLNSLIVDLVIDYIRTAKVIGGNVPEKP